MSRRKWIQILVPLLLQSPFVVAGQLLHIETVSPRIGQRGTMVEVTIQGMCLNDPREVAFYRPGIRAVSIESLPKLEHPIGLAHGGRIEDQVRCQFEIAPDCLPGEYPFRIRTAHEITSIGTFQVSPFPVVSENERGSNTNDTLKTALEVTPNVTVLGQMGQGSRGDIDLYRVPAVEGHRLSVEVDSVRIADVHYGGSEYDLAVRILDETGRELAANDDNPLHLQDPLVAVKLPRDGVAFVEVTRSVFVPSDRTYCVHIGSYQRPLAAFPPGGPAGTNQQFTLLGDPLGSYRQTIALPTTGDMLAYFGDAPSPLPLRVSAFPNVLENANEPVTLVEQLPAALNGIIEKRGDVDTFQMSAKKGDRYRVRVFAASIGSPIDPKILISSLEKSDDAAELPLESDDSQLPDRDIFGTSFRSGGGLKDILDPSVIWEPKVDGNYLLEIEDPSDSGGPTAVYRIEIEPVTDAVHNLLAGTGNDWIECIRTSGLTVPTGNRWTVNVGLPQGQGSSYRGELELVAHGLPDGVKLVTSRVPAGRTLWPVQFVADTTATACTALIELEAKPVDFTGPFESRSQQNIPFINHPGGDAWRTVRLDQFMLAVTDTAPFSVEMEAPSVALVRGGELAIPVKINRQPGFIEPVEFYCDWRPPGVGVQPTATIPAGENEAILRITGDANAPLGTCPLVVVASTTRDDVDAELGTGRIRVSSEIIELMIAEPFVELVSEPESLRRGERKDYRWTVQHKSPFEGTANVKLLGLPKGVTAVDPLPVLSKESKEITFRIEATDEALLGSVREVSCEVVVQARGQEIRQRTGHATLRIDPELK